MSNQPDDPVPDAVSLTDDDAKQRCDLDPIFKAGAQARERGRSKNDNPYAVGSQERDEWAAGYTASPDLDRDDDPNSPL